MGFYSKEEPAQPTADKAVTGTLSRVRKPQPRNAWPPILTVGIGHRFYSPGLGRWMSRDPIGERGGRNLYGHVRNRAVDLWDVLGLAETQPPCKAFVYLWVGHSMEIIRQLKDARYRSDTGCIKHVLVACRVSTGYELVANRFGLPESMISTHQPPIYTGIGGNEPPRGWEATSLEHIEADGPIYDKPGIKSTFHLAWLIHMRNIVTDAKAAAITTANEMASDAVLMKNCKSTKVQVIVRKVDGVELLMGRPYEKLTEAVKGLGSDGSVLYEAMVGKPASGGNAK